MVDVRVMRVAVGEGAMPVRVRVRLPGVGAGGMLMLVVVVVQFGQVQPDADAHERRRAPECQARPLRKHPYRDDGARERRGREIGAGTRRAKMA